MLSPEANSSCCRGFLDLRYPSCCESDAAGFSAWKRWRCGWSFGVSGRSCRIDFAKSGMSEKFQQNERYGLGTGSVGERPHTRWASFGTTAGSNQIGRSGQYLIPNFVQRATESNPSRIVVIDVDRGIEHGIVLTGVDHCTEIAPVAH